MAKTYIISHKDDQSAYTHSGDNYIFDMFEIIGIHRVWVESREKSGFKYFCNDRLEEVDKMRYKILSLQYVLENDMQIKMRLCKYWSKGQVFIRDKFAATNNKPISRRMLRRLSYSWKNMPVRTVFFANEIVELMLNYVFVENESDIELQNVFLDRICIGLCRECTLCTNKAGSKNCRNKTLGINNDVISAYNDGEFHSTKWCLSSCKVLSDKLIKSYEPLYNKCSNKVKGC